MKQASILLAEDQPFIALDLAFAITDAGGQVVGPAASVEDALALLATNDVAGAILDVNLLDGDCSDIVEALTALGVPMVLQTGMGLSPSMTARFPGLVAHGKPCQPAALVKQIAAMIADRAEAAGTAAKSS